MTLDGTTRRLDLLRSKRDQLLESPRAPASFGEWWPRWAAHHARWGRVSRAAVSAIEARCGMSIPAPYLGFVTEIADGGLGPGCGMFSLQEAVDEAPEWTGSPSTPFCYADARRVVERRAAGEAYALDQPNSDGLPHGCLLLAHTGCGCFDVLVINGEQRGKVWFHDAQRLFPLSQEGKQLSFLDWYESWLDASLKSLGT
jgi:hypothetical protein